jgi:transposase
LELIAREPDLTLAEIVLRLSQDRGVRTTDSSVDRFFQRHGMSFKKNSARGRAGAARCGRGTATLEGRTGSAR